jgi:hypothetical protein
MPGRDPVEVGKEIYDSLGSPLVRCLDDVGVTDEELAKIISEGIKATDQKVFQYRGEIIESADKVAWESRRNFVDMALKLKGRYPSEKHHVTVEGGLPVTQLSEEDRLEIEARKQVLKEKALRRDAKK